MAGRLSPSRFGVVGEVGKSLKTTHAPLPYVVELSSNRYKPLTGRKLLPSSVRAARASGWGKLRRECVRLLLEDRLAEFTRMDGRVAGIAASDLVGDGHLRRSL